MFTEPLQAATSKVADVGDWVLFYSAGKPTIAEVRYIRRRTGGYIQLLTDNGAIDDNAVLEVRRKG